ncbi:MAG: sigma-70 family RNA polymerase sigma factor [Verrucomicrobiota bacterium]
MTNGPISRLIYGMDGESATATNDEFALIESALAGDEAAASALRTSERTGRLESILERRGASRTEARDIVADLWSDCFNTGTDRGSLLDRFSGKGSIDAFLTRTALNRLIDYKRRQRFRGDLPGSNNGDGEVDVSDRFDRLPAEKAAETEDSLIGLLRESLVHAFRNCDAEKLVILRLVNQHGIDQTTVGRMWGWSQSKISRAISSLMDEIRDYTLEELQRRDPWLDLQWHDFVELCRESNELFTLD